MTFLRAWGRWRLLLALAFLPVSCLVARASPAREELLRLVPDDVALCLVVQDLRAHAERLQAAPWMKRILESPFGQALTAAPEMHKLADLDGELQRRLHLSLAQLRDDIFGDAVVFAYRQGPPGEPARDQGLFLLWARDSQRLVDLAERVSKEQEQSGELKALEARAYRGIRYYRRQEARAEHFYFLSGHLLAFSEREALLRQVIDRRLAAPGSVQPALARRLHGTERALASFWLNPRAFDEDLRQKEAAATGAEAHVLQAFRTYWQALDGLGLALVVDSDLELQLSAQGRLAAFPPAFRRLLQTAAVPSELWGRFPRDAVVTAAGRIDLAALDGVFADFMTPEARENVRLGLQRSLGAALGADLFEEVLPRLGPDCGFCLAVPPPGTGLPQALLALRVQPGPAQAPVDQGLLRAGQVLAGLAVFDHNRSAKGQLRLRDLKQEQVEGMYLTGDGGLPEGLEPAFALKGGYLVLASSPAALQRFAGPAVAAAPLEVPLLRLSLRGLTEFVSKRSPQAALVLSAGCLLLFNSPLAVERLAAAPAAFAVDVPLLRVSVRGLAAVVRARGSELAGKLAEGNRVPPEVAARWVEGLLTGLGLADRLEVTQRAAAGQVTWTVRLRAAGREK